MVYQNELLEKKRIEKNKWCQSHLPLFAFMHSWFEKKDIKEIVYKACYSLDTDSPSK